MSALSLDPPVSLFEPATATTATQARRGRPGRIPLTRGVPTHTSVPTESSDPTDGSVCTDGSASADGSVPTDGSGPTDGTLNRADRVAAAQQHGRRAARPAAPRARRASAASTFSPALLLAVGRLVGVRALGIGLAAAAVTFALASKGAGPDVSTDAGTVASLSVRGLAVAAILGAAWGFQDRPRLGTLQTVRAWYGTAAVIGAAHALWIVATMPGAPDAQLAAALSAFALDAVLVATPALLGARAGRPDVPSTLAPSA